MVGVFYAESSKKRAFLGSSPLRNNALKGWNHRAP
jgi:hypothetical protein